MNNRSESCNSRIKLRWSKCTVTEHNLFSILADNKPQGQVLKTRIKDKLYYNIESQRQQIIKEPWGLMEPSNILKMTYMFHLKIDKLQRMKFQ